MNEEYGPITKICEICESEDGIDFMVVCPEYSEDIERSIIPGWIHKECCEEEFIEQGLHRSVRHMVYLTVSSLRSNKQLDDPDFP